MLLSDDFVASRFRLRLKLFSRTPQPSGLLPIGLGLALPGLRGSQRAVQRTARSVQTHRLNGQQRQQQRGSGQDRAAQRRQIGMPANPPPPPLPPGNGPSGDRFPGQEPLQVVGELLRTGVTVRRPLGQRFQADLLQVRIEARIQLPRPHGFAVSDVVQHGGKVLGLEQRLAGQQNVQHGPQSVNVGRDGQGRLTGVQTFRGQISRRAHHRARLRQLDRVVQTASQAKIGNKRRAGVVQQDVGRLHVAMQHAALVGMMHRVCHIDHHLRRTARIVQPAAAVLLQIAALHQLHRKVLNAIHLAHVIDRHDARMVQLGHRDGFFQKPMFVGTGTHSIRPHDL